MPSPRGPAIIPTGRRLVDDPRVRFFDSIPEALSAGHPDLAFGVGLLPMVPDPFGMADQIAASGARRVFLDRIPVIDGAGRDLCTRQIVPHSI